MGRFQVSLVVSVDEGRMTGTLRYGLGQAISVRLDRLA
jgi:hypothetical protein